MKVFNICDYGAVFSDQLQTKAIQNAIDDCFLAGGGRVLVPCGIYMTGGLRLRSNVELYLEAGAILKGSRNPDDYQQFQFDTLEPVTMEPIGKTPATGRSAVATSRWSNGLIRALDAKNIAVIGEKGSYIDGSNAFDAEGEENYRGPHGMSIWRCENVRFEGYTFIHCANWCHAIFQSQNITVRNVKIYGGHDGVDVRTCDNVLIEDCAFNTGDDCVAGFDNHDVIVRNCIFNCACQAMRFGGNNVLFENCTIQKESGFGFRHYMSPESKKRGEITDESCRHEMVTAFSYYCDHRAVLRKPAENITLRNCHFAQVKEMFRLEFDGFHRWCCNRSLRQILIEDCSFDNLLRAGELWGDENEKVICHFKNVRITPRAGSEDIPLFIAANFEKIIFEDCTIEGYENPTILMGTEGTVEVIRSTPVTLQESNMDECLAYHKGGIAWIDQGKNLTFQLKAK